jgi:hypothetical protein
MGYAASPEKIFSQSLSSLDGEAATARETVEAV